MANFSLLAKLGLDTKAFNSGLKSAEGRVNKFKAVLSKLGPVLGGIGLTKLATDAINLGSSISDMAVQLRIGAEQLQVLEFAARKAGVETSIMERSIRNVQLRTQQGIEGNKSYANAYKVLGLSIEAVNKLPAEQKLETIARAAKGAKDQQAAYNAVARILGERAGPKMMEILDDLAKEGFPALARAAKDAGEVMDLETIQKMDDAADTLESFKRKVTVASAFIINKVMNLGVIFRDSFGHIGDAMVSLSIKLDAFVKFLGNSFSIVLSPVMDGLSSLVMGFEALGHAMVGDFDGFRITMKKGERIAEDASRRLLEIPKNLGDAYRETDQIMKDVNEVMEVDTKRRNENIAQAFKDFFGLIEKESENTSKNISGDAQSMEGSLYGTAGAAAATAEELAKMNKARMDDLKSELDSVHDSIESVESKIDSTKHKILDLNSSNLDELLETFGVTAEELGNELEKQINASGKTSSEMSADELERAYGKAIANIRARIRDEMGSDAFSDSFSGIMPDEAELDQIMQLMKTVSQQSAALAEAPETVKSLTEELQAYNEELGVLQQKESELEAEITELDSTLEAVSEAVENGAGKISTEADALAGALSTKASEISNIVIPGAKLDGGESLMTDIGSRLDTTNDYLKSIDQSLQGKFVNQ
jgi:prefoldin subunit 5